MPRMLLPDINVGLALTFDGHVHHPAAKNWFDALSTDVCLFCRLTNVTVAHWPILRLTGPRRPEVGAPR